MRRQLGDPMLCLGVLLLLFGNTALGQFSADDDPSLVGLWRLNDGTGDTATDDSPNGNHGTLQGDPEWVVGALDGALAFDGNGDYVDFGNNPVFDITEQVTLAIWVNANDMGNGEHNAWLGKGDTTYAIKHQNNNRIEFFIYSGDWQSVFYEGNVENLNGEWHHMAGTFDGTELMLYVDGEPGPPTAFSGPIGTANYNVTLADNSQERGRYFDGMLDDARIYNRALTQEEIGIVMLGGGMPELADDPLPENEATDVLRDGALSWEPGVWAVTHDVYLGTSFDDVNNASRNNPMDVLLSQGQTDTSFSPGPLEYGQTYYWRVDEVNGAPDNTVFKGELWSFTVEPFAYAITHIIATSNGASEPGAGPERTVDGSGLNANDEHSTDAGDMWLAAPGDEPLQIQYEFDHVYKLYEMLVWNYNVQFELLLGFGLKDVSIEYSEDGTDWTLLGDVTLNQGTATETYAANTTIEFGGVPVRYVRLTVTSGYGVMGQFGLSEVRFLQIPAQARQPEPNDGATGVSIATTLAWRAGRDAISHDVYFGSDPEALTLADTPSDASYTPDVMDLDTTYCWKVDETSGTDGLIWESNVWSFTTQEYLVVDDFESYDDVDNLIFDTWIDGWGNGTGATVGYLEAPFAERTIVNSGKQSMPLSYDNTNVTTSEADLPLSQDWTASGIRSLSLYFYGDPANSGGQLYVRINDTKIVYDGPNATLDDPSWQRWDIDLTAAGNVSNVTSLTIGIEGAGAKGRLFIDDIRLYPETNL